MSGTNFALVVPLTSNVVIQANFAWLPVVDPLPTNVLVVEGSNALLNASAKGAPPLAYQWQYDGVPIPGAIDLNYHIVNAQTNNDGFYSLVLSNHLGVVTSTPALLIVYQPVSIMAQPQGQLLPLGATANLTVGASGWPAPSFQWTFNGTNLPGATSNTLIIQDLDLPNLGNYLALVSNAYSSTQSVTATLTMSPSLAGAFGGETGIFGQGATLGVGAEGSGTFSYQWSKNGVLISGADNPGYSIQFLQYSDAGLYSVVVSSAYGSVTNTPELLVVNPPNISLGAYAGLTISGSAGSRLFDSVLDELRRPEWVGGRGQFNPATARGALDGQQCGDARMRGTLLSCRASVFAVSWSGGCVAGHLRGGDDFGDGGLLLSDSVFDESRPNEWLDGRHEFDPGTAGGDLD